MTMQKMISKSEYVNRQQYRQIAATTANNNHRYMRYAKYHKSER